MDLTNALPAVPQLNLSQPMPFGQPGSLSLQNPNQRPFQPPPAPQLSAAPPMPPMPQFGGANPTSLMSPIAQQMLGGIGQGVGYGVAGSIYGQMFPQGQAQTATTGATTATPPNPPSTTPKAPATPSVSSSSAINNSSPKAFVQSLSSTAQSVSAQTGIPANILLAIAANETGWGTSMVGNNLMGIKGTGPAGSTNSPTWESVNGKAVNTTGNFRDYNSPAQSMLDFSNFLNQNPRYSSALSYLKATGDANGFIQQVNQAGFATDPNWASKIISISQTIPSMMG